MRRFMLTAGGFGLMALLALIIRTLAIGGPQEASAVTETAVVTEATPNFEGLFQIYYDDLDAARDSGAIQSQGVYTSLLKQAQGAQADWYRGDVPNAQSKLKALLNELHAAAGNQIAQPDADILIADVMAIMQYTGGDGGIVAATPTIETTAISTLPPMPPTPYPLTTTPVITEPSGQPCEGTPIVEQLTVWSGPNFNEESRLGFINPGEVFSVYAIVTGDTPFNTDGYTTNFYQIGYYGLLAWTPAEYLRLSGDCIGLVRLDPDTLQPATLASTVLPSPTLSLARVENWTLYSTYISSDQCSGAATVDVTVPVTVEFDDGGRLVTLTWYSRVWIMYSSDGVNFSGDSVVAGDPSYTTIVDTANITFTSTQTFDGDMTRIVTPPDSTLPVCKAYYTWHGVKN